MLCSTRRTAHGWACALAVVAMVACDPAEPAVPSAATGHDHAFSHNPAPGSEAEVNQWLAQLRRQLAHFQRYEVANSAGYRDTITTCFEQQGAGGMGYHIGKGSLIDGVVEELKPELLLYEPQKNGRMQLVAVEYIVPYTAWPSTSPGPVLHGVPFAPNDAFGIWALHAWVFEHNPRGMFMDWNPSVSCTFAN